MPEIERYTGIGCPRIHLRLYSTIMRAHGLDGAQMIMLFPMSLGGAAQRWFASLDVSRRRTWDDLAQEFLRQYAFNTVIDVSRRELEALRQRSDESVSSFISRWRGKIAEIVDRPSERDQIQMVLRSLQPRIARHVVGVPFTDFGSLALALYDVEDGISREASQASSAYPQLLEARPSYTPQQYRPRAPYPTYDQIYQPQPLALPYYATQSIERPPISYTATGQPCYAASSLRDPQLLIPDPELSRLLLLCFEDAETALRKLTEAGVLAALTPRPPPQPIPPQFRMDLHCAYHQGPGHETDRCTALRHAIQDLIDQGLVHLGQPSVTTNPLPAHTTHAVPPPADGIHFLEFDEIDDHIHMLSDDDSDPEPIMPDVIYEMSGVTLGPRMPAPFRLVPEAASVQAATVEPLILPHYSVRTPFILIPDVEEVQAPHVDDSQTLDIQYVLRGGRVMRQPPPAAARPVEGTSAPEEVRAEDDEILRQLQSTQARISIWSLLASSSTHRDALTRALSQIRVDTTTTPEGLIHMMTAAEPHASYSQTMICHLRAQITRVHSTYLSVVQVAESHLSFWTMVGPERVPLATAIALGYAPSDFGPSTQTVRAYDSTRREVMGTLEIELLIGPATFRRKVKFIHDGRVVVVQSAGDRFISAEPVLEISHADDDLFLTGFTFDEVQTLEMEDFCRDFVAMSFDQHSSTVVLDIMRSMSYLPGMGLGRRQHGPSEFMAFRTATYHSGSDSFPLRLTIVIWRDCAGRG
ncbi:uncharacterized protein LOC117930461 [Vitis riparia]|uniref:uncharacterized protein LOC117930461 n=1 Tax=Vitis riparia TaxID=96939 RepID=UPI00155A9346|nr:uncharacterized protein LOC117930461 [Vitis riparia]